MQLEQDEAFDRAYAAIPYNNEVAKNVFPAREKTFMHELLDLDDSDDEDDEVDDSILSRPVDPVSSSSSSSSSSTSSSLPSSSSSAFSPLGAGHLPYYEARGDKRKPSSNGKGPGRATKRRREMASVASV